MAYRPLADEIRPQTLDEVVGQKHILGREGLLRRIIEGQHHRPADQPAPAPAERHYRVHQ